MTTRYNNCNMELFDDKFYKNIITKKSKDWFISIPNSKAILGAKGLENSLLKHPPKEFWNMYHYLTTQFQFNTSHITNRTTISKYQLLRQLNCSRYKLDNGVKGQVINSYLSLIYECFDYMINNSLISNISKHPKDCRMNDFFSFEVSKYHYYEELNNKLDKFVKIYPFEFYTIFSNNKYGHKVRLNLFNLYLAIKVYSVQKDKDCKVCIKTKRSLSNLTGIPPATLKRCLVQLKELNLITTELVVLEYYGNTSLVVPADVDDPQAEFEKCKQKLDIVGEANELDELFA